MSGCMITRLSTARRRQENRGGGTALRFCPVPAPMIERRGQLARMLGSGFGAVVGAVVAAKLRQKLEESAPWHAVALRASVGSADGEGGQQRASGGMVLAHHLFQQRGTAVDAVRTQIGRASGRERVWQYV